MNTGGQKIKGLMLVGMDSEVPDDASYTRGAHVRRWGVQLAGEDTRLVSHTRGLSMKVLLQDEPSWQN